MRKRLLAALLCLAAILVSGCDMFPVPSGSASPQAPAATDPADTVAATAGPATGAPADPTAERTAEPTKEPTEEPTPTPEPTPAPDPAEGMIFPDSDDRLLMWEELIGLGADKLDLARNEIFARAGYSFTKDYYRDYYGKLHWYKADPGFSESGFTETQSANITLIRAAESAIRGKLLEIKSGTKLDFDQDGVLETLTFSAPDDYHMNLKMKDGTASTPWSVECEMPSKKVYLGDIDLGDGLLDLFVDAFGPSDDYSAFIAGAKHKAFLKRGEIPGRIGQLKLKGDGVIGTNRRMSILMTWFCGVNYKLDPSGKLVFQKKDSYPMGNFKCKTKVAIPLRASASDTAAVSLTVPAGTEVQLVSTDDVKWIRIKAPGGTGWLEMADPARLKDPNLYGYDAFDGLDMAD